MAFPLPTVDDFKEQFPGDFPFGVPGFGASGVASITGGVVTGVALSDGGTGYKTPPTVALAAIPGDPGIGAAATAAVSAGLVTSVAVANPGTGYVNPPAVSFTCVDGDPTDLERVRDADVALAIKKGASIVPNGIWPDEPTYVIAFNLATAHYLTLAMRSRFNGIRGQGGDWLMASKSVADIAASYDFPEKIKRNPLLAQFMGTSYGCEYLGMVSQYLIGAVFTVCAPGRP